MTGHRTRFPVRYRSRPALKPRQSLQRALLAWILGPTVCLALVPVYFVAVHAQTALSAKPDPVVTEIPEAPQIEADIRAARARMAMDPAAEQAVRSLVDSLVRAGRKQEALAEADRFIARGNATSLLRAQRGFLRRELNDLKGAIEDFAEAGRPNDDLSADQRLNVENALVEARAAQIQSDINSAQAALLVKDYVAAADKARSILERLPNSEQAMSIRLDALIANGQKREALVEIDRFIVRGFTNPTFRAQRAFLRREFGDLAGAAEDFNAVLASPALRVQQRQNVQAGLAEIQDAQAQVDLGRAQAALKQGNFKAAIDAADAAARRNPKSEDIATVRVEALWRSGLRGQALAEADRFIAENGGSSAFRAQRGFYRRQRNDLAGAVGDFNAALASQDLSAEQRRNVDAALAEARRPNNGRSEADRAQAALTQGNYNGAAEIAAGILRHTPNSDPAMRIRIDALVRAGRSGEAEREIGGWISSGTAKGWAYAQRGFLRRDAGDFQGAADDFDAALGRGDLGGDAASNVRYARTEAVAMVAEQQGNPQAAEAAYRAYAQSEPTRADGWYKFGYLLMSHGHRDEGAEALASGLNIHPVGTAYLDAANAFILSNAPKASKFYRQGLDRYYAKDPTLVSRSEVDIERIKNEVVEADASIRTTVSIGGITSRPEAAGGANDVIGAETRVRFDGRYLASMPGLEAFVRGLSDKNANGERETDAALGLRFRPVPNLNLYVGGSVNQFFQPRSETEIVFLWGLGLGADAYPYIEGWTPYWDFGTFGAWRTADGRVLQDVRANAGFLYEFRAPFRGAIGPTILGIAGYDNLATTPWAAGIGPSVLAYAWLGGDKYRSYDALLSFQIGYLVNVGNDARQRGLRAQVGVTF
jgi:tetratricopeptide (TPR) repeat protein